MTKKIVIMLIILLLMIAVGWYWATNSTSKRPYEQNPLTNPKPPATTNPPDPATEHQDDGTAEQEEPENDQAYSDQLRQMSLDEKIGQLIIAGIPGATLDQQTSSLLQDHHIGGFIFFSRNFQSPEQSFQLINQLKLENKHASLPLLLSVDQEGGTVSRLLGFPQLPTAQVIGKTNDPDYAYAIGKILAKQLHAYGLNMNYAPVLDIQSNPNNTVIGSRAFGSNKELVSNLGGQVMRAMQDEGILAAIKHFPGHGDTAVDSHYALPVIQKNLAELKDLELVPFSEALQFGADVVMMGHILLPKLDEHKPASLSSIIINDLLRSELQFNGLVVTDDLTMQAITNEYLIGEAAVQAIVAGSDLILLAHAQSDVIASIDAIRAAIKQGVLTEERIDESVLRIIEFKQKYQLADEPLEHLDIESVNALIEATLR